MRYAKAYFSPIAIGDGEAIWRDSGNATLAQQLRVFDPSVNTRV
jgi:hypothetical protein